MGTKEIELTLDEVRELDDFEGVFMVVGETVRLRTVGLSPRSGYVETVSTDGDSRYWTVAELLHLQARFVRTVEDHPHGRVETDPAKARPVQFSDGRIAVLVATRPGDTVPWVVTQRGALYRWMYDDQVQALADKYGFEYLVPESAVEAAREEGWGAGIAEVGRRLSVENNAVAARFVRGEYPEAFGGESRG